MPDLSILTSNDFCSKSGIFVDLFFILSGFVIYHNYKNKSFDQTMRLTFIKKRLKRLLPLHFYTLFVLLGLEIIKYLSYDYLPFSQAPFSANSWDSFWPQLLLVNSTPFFVDFSWNGPNWSISAELISYLFFVLTSVLSFRKLQISFLISAFVVGLGYLFFYINYDTFDTTIDFNFSFIRGLIGFNLGVCTYIIASRCQMIYKKISKTVATLFELIAIISVISLVSAINPEIKDNFYILHLVFSLLIFVFSFEGGILSNMFKLSGFQNIGHWSYSIYLNHFFLIAIFQMVAVKLLKLQGAWILIAENVLLIILLFYSRITYNRIERRFYNRLNK